MRTEKEVTAFVERVVKRLSDAPYAPQNGQHRAAFVALRPLIAGALASGCTIKAAWATLRDEKKLTMNYQTFRTYCRRAGIGQPVRTAAPAMHPRPEPLRPAGSIAVRPAVAGPAGLTQPRFRHERVPREKDIHG